MIDWAKVKEELQNELGFVKFSLDGHEIGVVHMRKKTGLSSKGTLWVHIDGSINTGWDAKSMPIISKVWCTNVKPLYSKKEIDKYAKEFGKREAKKDLHGKTHTFLIWGFSSLTKFIRQYKKLEKEGLVIKERAEDFLLEEKPKVKKKSKGLFDE